MTTDPFVSSREKLDRAEFHVHELAKVIWDHIQQLEREGKPMFTFEQEYRRRSRCIVFRVSSVQPADRKWGVAVGDIFHNYRSALDHIAWALVSAGGRPPDMLNEGQKRRVQFPIYTKREDFNAWLPKRLPGVDRYQRAVIRAYQPYRWGKRNAWKDALAVLEHFSNLDKHRTLQLAFFRPFGTVLASGDAGAADFDPMRPVIAKSVMWHPGTEVLRVYGRKLGPNPRLDVKISSSAEVSLEGGFWMGDTFRMIRLTTERIMSTLRPLMR